MRHIIQLIRPHQYVKNLFIFMPLFFAGKVTHFELLIPAVLAFVAFSAAASGVYVLNDYLDIDADRKHPRKQHRPLASGAISKQQAWIIMSIALVTGISLMSALSLQGTMILCMYIIINVAYSLKLKHIALVDITIIAIGFVLRLFIGEAVTDVPLSMWIIIMTFLLALFMALAKRRDDVLIFMDTGKKMRTVVDGYNLQLIDNAMMVMSAVVVMSYILYTTSDDILEKLHSPYLYLTSLFVILGVLRYMQITYVEQGSGSPTQIFIKDRFIQLTVLGWLAAYGWIIYL